MEISTWRTELKFLGLNGKFHPGLKISKKFQLGKNQKRKSMKSKVKVMSANKKERANSTTEKQNTEPDNQNADQMDQFQAALKRELLLHLNTINVF